METMHIYINSTSSTISLTPTQVYKMTDAITSAKEETGTDRPTEATSMSVVPSFNIEVDKVITKPKIQRVPEHLLRNNKRRQEFKPEVVSIGPFHANNIHLKLTTDELKKEAAEYVVEHSIYTHDMFKNKVRELSSEAKEYYVDMPPGVSLSDDEFVDMLFYDGCFLLQFVDLFVENRLHKMKCNDLQRSIVRDMFLLENQLPLFVLRALMNFMPDVNLEEFIDRIIGNPPYYSWRRGRDVKEDIDKSFHLLDLLRSRLLGPEDGKAIPRRIKVRDIQLRDIQPSAANLKEVGIIFRNSQTRQLRDIQFKKGLLRSFISVPHLVVDDFTSSRFLNLIAWEMCADRLPDNGITSYVWLMHHFIDHAEDVKELSSRGVLLNAFGSDQQVAYLFNVLGRDLPPRDQEYYNLTLGITQECNRKCRQFRLSTSNMLETHFSSPWSAIAFLTGVLLTILSVIQTIFTVWPRK